MSGREHRHRPESGMSLVEVIVALALIGIIAAGAATFFIKGVATSSKLQRDQAAATVATQAMEVVRAVDAQDPEVASVTNNLLLGRSETAVKNQWNAAEATDTAATTAAWDANSTTATGTATIPLVSTTRVSDMTYTVNTLIGVCYRPSAASRSAQECVATPATGVKTFRVTVVVTWKERGCSSFGCSYRLATLVDPTADPSWNLSTNPVPIDDEATMVAGGPRTLIWVWANDEMEAAADNRTELVEDPAAPSHGAVELATGVSAGGINYTPPSDFSGIDEFKYQLIDSVGRKSKNTATVRVLVLPDAVDDAVMLEAGDSIDFDVLHNDLGTKDGIEIVSGPPSGYSAAVVGGKVRISAPSSAHTGDVVSFTYNVITDAGKIGTITSEPPATVTVTVGSCMNIADLTIDIPVVRSGDTPVDLEINKLNDNKSYCLVEITKITVVGGPAGQFKVGDSNYNADDNRMASVIRFQPQANAPALLQVTYRMWSKDKAMSTPQTKTITLRIVPVAVPDVYSVNVGQSRVLEVRADNDAPSDNTVKLKIVTGLDTGCGSMIVNESDGKVNYTAPSVKKSGCGFTYQLISTAVPTVVSDTVAVTINIGDASLHGSVTDVFSRTAQSGQSGTQLDERVEKILDKDDKTKWYVNTGSFSSPDNKFPVAAIYTLSSAAKLTTYSITSGDDEPGRDPATWLILGSNDPNAAQNPSHSSWTQVDSQSGQTFGSRKQNREFTASKPGSYRYYQLSVTAVKNGGKEFQIANWTLVN